MECFGEHNGRDASMWTCLRQGEFKKGIERIIDIYEKKLAKRVFLQNIAFVVIGKSPLLI